MNFDLTRSNLFATTFYSLVLLVVFWGTGAGVAAIDGAYQLPNPQSYFVSLYLDGVIERFPSLCRALAALLAFVCSLVVAQLSIRSVLYLERTYMPSLLFVIISSAFYVAGESLLPLIVALLVLMAVRAIFRSYQIKNLATGAYLTAGVYFGIAATIYPPSAYLALMLFAGLGAFRINDVREWTATLVGLALPLGLSFYVYWALGGDFVAQAELYLQQLYWHDNLRVVFDNFTPIDYTLWGVLFVLVVFSYVVFLISRSKYKLRSRMNYNYLMCLFLWALVVMIFSPSRTFYMMPVVAVPMSVVIPTYFASRRPTFLSNFLYALLIMSAIAMHLVR